MLHAGGPAGIKSRVQRFKPAPASIPVYAGSISQEITTEHLLVKKQLALLLNATVGCRWQTVQKVAYTLECLENPRLLDAITACIERNSAFAGQEVKYIKCAGKCFADGAMCPLKQDAFT